MCNLARVFLVAAYFYTTFDVTSSKMFSQIHRPRQSPGQLAIATQGTDCRTDVYNPFMVMIAQREKKTFCTGVLTRIASSGKQAVLASPNCIINGGNVLVGKRNPFYTRRGDARSTKWVTKITYDKKQRIQVARLNSQIRRSPDVREAYLPPQKFDVMNNLPLAVSTWAWGIHCDVSNVKIEGKDLILQFSAPYSDDDCNNVEIWGPAIKVFRNTPYVIGVPNNVVPDHKNGTCYIKATYTRVTEYLPFIRSMMKSA